MATHEISDTVASVTFNENLVNGEAQLIDADVTLVDSPNGWNGGVLTVSGLLAEDRVSILNQGTASGQIGLSGANVTYGGVVIGTLAGGSGATLTVTFNSSATVAAIEALIEHLTYANVSNTPTAARDLTINLTDANGEGLGINQYSARTGAFNAFNGVDVDSWAAPTFGDLDNDGDLDMVLGHFQGSFHYFENTGDAANPVFVERTNGLNPLDGLGFMPNSGTAVGTPQLVDLDGDGDLDVVSGMNLGEFFYWENVGDIDTPQFVARTGANNPFNGLNAGPDSGPGFGDIDGDGDLDFFSGQNNGPLRYFENTGTNLAPSFVERTGSFNPMNGVMPGVMARPQLVDTDSDGDLDLVVGIYVGGVVRYYENIGTDLAPVFVERSGADNPWDGVSSLDYYAALALVDIDDDGDLDTYVGNQAGTITYYENTASGGLPKITINVTAQTEGPTMLADTLVGTSGADVIGGQAGNDEIYGLDGADRIDGDKGDDVIYGGGGNDKLKGGAGNDALYGGAGDDIYVVDDAGDVVSEAGGDGVDTVHSTISFTLAAGVENLLLLGTAASGTGSSDDNTITGNATANELYGQGGADTLFGEGGNDSLYGGEGNDLVDGGKEDDNLYGEDGDDRLLGQLGNDRLFGGADRDTLEGGKGDDALDGGSGADLLLGGAGNDVLDGGLGADQMTGEAGNDVYSVNDSGDLVIEAAGGGTDTVYSLLAVYTLAAEVENLVLDDAAGQVGYGNALRNVITSGKGSDTLWGMGGQDTLDAGGGNDSLYGGADNDNLSGGDGDDRLDGGAGADQLRGGSGADVFAFGVDAPGAIDRILDLSFGDGDVIDVSAIDANTLLDGDQAFAFVARFSKAAGQAVASYSAAKDTTTVLFDVNGDGKADFQISIAGNHTGSTGNTYLGDGDTDGGWLL